MTTCGLCLHRPHPANQCAEVHQIHAPHSRFVTERIACACWAEAKGVGG